MIRFGLKSSWYSIIIKLSTSLQKQCCPQKSSHCVCVCGGILYKDMVLSLSLLFHCIIISRNLLLISRRIFKKFVFLLFLLTLPKCHLSCKFCVLLKKKAHFRVSCRFLNVLLPAAAAAAVCILKLSLDI